jgi:hypothetical protein
MVKASKRVGLTKLEVRPVHGERGAGRNGIAPGLYHRTNHVEHSGA